MSGKLLPVYKTKPHNMPTVRCYVCGFGSGGLVYDSAFDRFRHSDPKTCEERRER